MMAKMFKKSLSFVLIAVLSLALAVPAFASTRSYQFYYAGSYDSHSSSYISGPADISGGNVTITLTGNYFPELVVGGVTYYGSYDPITNKKTFTFPGSDSSDIPVSLHVYVFPVHDDWYNLTLHWL